MAAATSNPASPAPQTGRRRRHRRLSSRGTGGDAAAPGAFPWGAAGQQP